MKRAIIQPEDALDVPSTAGNGEPKLVERFDMAGACVQFTVSSGEFRLEASVDGSTWVSVATAAASTVVNFNAAPHNHFWRYIRVVTTSDGTATATLGAHEFI